MDNEILSNIYATIQAFWMPIHVCGILIGLIMFGSGLIKLASSRQQGNSKAAAGGLMLGGVLLVNTNQVLTIFTSTLLGTGGGDFTFTASVAAGPGQAYMQVAVAAVKCIGAFGFIRGCCLLRSSDGERSAVWGGLVHIVGGVLALNLEVFAVMLGDTFGGSFGETVRSLFN